MVPRRYIYGKAVFIYWPLEKMGLANIECSQSKYTLTNLLRYQFKSCF